MPAGSLHQSAGQSCWQARSASPGWLRAGYLGVEDGTLPGRSRLRELLGQNGPDGSLPDVPGGLMCLERSYPGCG